MVDGAVGLQDVNRSYWKESCLGNPEIKRVKHFVVAVVVIFPFRKNTSGPCRCQCSSWIPKRVSCRLHLLNFGGHRTLFLRDIWRDCFGHELEYMGESFRVPNYLVFRLSFCLSPLVSLFVAPLLLLVLVAALIASSTIISKRWPVPLELRVQRSPWGVCKRGIAVSSLCGDDSLPRWPPGPVLRVWLVLTE